MRQLQRVLVFLFAVLTVAGCSAPSGSDGGADVVPQDVLGGDAARDAVDVPAVDTGHMDTGSDAVNMTDAGTDVSPMMDSGTDAVTVADSGSDVRPMIDTGTDAVTITDTGTDVIAMIDTGTDTSLPDVPRPDVTTPDAGGPPDATVSDGGGPPMCSGTMHVCICATGYYCLRIGLGCLSPSSPCP